MSLIRCFAGVPQVFCSVQTRQANKAKTPSRERQVALQKSHQAGVFQVNCQPHYQWKENLSSVPVNTLLEGCVVDICGMLAIVTFVFCWCRVLLGLRSEIYVLCLLDLSSYCFHIVPLACFGCM